jgi:hypothetical protein
MSADLVDTFLDAEGYFNRADLTSLKPLLHDEVIMWHVDDRQPPIIGKSDVVAYLKPLAQGDWSHFEHLPSGQPLPPPRQPGESTFYYNGASGVVQGTAFWKDKSSDPDTTKRLIRYVFAFQKVDNQWLIRHLKGSLI